MISARLLLACCAALALPSACSAPDAGARKAAASSSSAGRPSDVLVLVASFQESDGRWAADGPFAWREHDRRCPCAWPEHSLDDDALTALVLLSFLEDGQTQDTGPLRTNVARGLNFLLRNQARDTGLIGSGALVGHLYGHVLATAALGEALTFTSDPELAAAFAQALRALEAARGPEVWSASIDGSGEPDIYVSAWAANAFAVARELEFDIDPRVIADVEPWLEGQLGLPDGLVEAPNTRAATAAALWARVRLMASDADRSALERSLRALSELQDAREDITFECELDGTLLGSYATLMASHGPSWKRWSRTMERVASGPEFWRSRTLRGTSAAMLGLAVQMRYARVLVR